MNTTVPLVKRILRRIRPLLRRVSYFGDPPDLYECVHLINAATELVSAEGKSDEAIEREIFKMVASWILDDYREHDKSAKRRLVTNRPINRKSPNIDYTTLPWGSVVHQITNSGVVNDQIAVVIEPETADKLVDADDAADRVLKILDYVMKNWGQHGMCWFVASKEDFIGTELKRLNIPDDRYNTEQQKIRRILNRITEDIKLQFKEE